MARWVWWASETQKGETTSRAEARRRLARAIGRVSLRGLPTAEGGAGETYYYGSRAERDRDGTGAYAWAVYPTDPEQEEASP